MNHRVSFLCAAALAAALAGTARAEEAAAPAGSQPAMQPAPQPGVQAGAAASMPASASRRPQAEQPALVVEQRAAMPPQLFPPSYDEAITALVRSFDLGALLDAGLDKAFARLPAKIGPMPKARYIECSRAKLSVQAIETAVRPALSAQIGDADLAIRLARLLDSPVGQKTRQAALAGTELRDAGITVADTLEFNRHMENRALREFMESGGLRRMKEAVSRTLDAEGRRAANACVKELVPLYRLRNERAA
ncbi:hypothetical protein ACKI2N_011130 [Cupriavidus sp. 30B13]|uniref:hypothetical protein n=1 Tax=Cupriavidus sp. 30B13 TaxID=3384241 RepID=UPI003B9195E8